MVMDDFNIEFDKKEPNIGKFNNVCDTFSLSNTEANKDHQDKKSIEKTCKTIKIYLNQYISIFL